MTDTDPNRLGPVTREWVTALERRIEELEAKYERLETIASMQPEPQHGDVRVGTAANDLSQALIVDGEAIPPGCVPPPLEGPLGDDPCIDLSGAVCGKEGTK